MSRAVPAALLLATVVAAMPAAAQVGKPLTITNANVATEAQLGAVPGFTPAIVKALVAKRPFLRQADFDAFLAGESLSPEQRKAAYEKVFVQLDLNETTREEILMLPMGTNRWVREFFEYRPYKGLAQFHKEMSKYVDEDKVNAMEQYVFVKIDLNAASDDDILTIPGVGARMLREFKEYRPWKTIAQFDKEIGKYVKAEELARLRRYVEIR